MLKNPGPQHLYPLALGLVIGVGWFGGFALNRLYSVANGALVMGPLAGLAYYAWTRWQHRQRTAITPTQIALDQDRELQAIADVLAPLGEAGGNAAFTLLEHDLAADLWASVGLGRAATDTAPAVYPTVRHGDTHLGLGASSLGVRVWLDMPRGYTDPDIYHRAGAKLANALRVPDARFDSISAGVCVLDLITRTPLADPVELPWPIPEQVDLGAVHIGYLDTGDPFLVPIRGGHLLVAGLSGSGKSGLIWSILAGLAPAIRDGLVEIHMMDLKRGTEMSAGYAWYSSWATTALEAIDKLQRLCDHVLATRADAATTSSMATGEPMRKHIPTTDDPHHVVFIDELLALLALPGDEVIEIEDEFGSLSKVKVTKYAVKRLMELLTQARALGITVVAATQLVNKAVLDLIRDLFTNVIGLRLASADQEEMVFGRGARVRGVRCTELTNDDAGTCYVLDERGGSAKRARVFHVPDHRIKDLLREYARRNPSPGLPRSAAFAAHLNTQPGAAGHDGSAPLLSLHSHTALDEPDQPKLCPAPSKHGKGICGNPVIQSGVGRPAKYCSDTCKQRYHRAKPDQTSVL